MSVTVAINTVKSSPFADNFAHVYAMGKHFTVTYFHVVHLPFG